MRIILDHREGKLKELFQNSKYEIEYQNLPQGDIQILYNDTVFAVFERKTHADLESSIIDGRYRNQKKALLEVFPASNIYYILEGDYVKSSQIMGTVINTQMRDKIGVFETRSIDGTYELLCGIFDRIEKDPQKYVGGATSFDFTARKPSSRDPIFVNMLAQISGVSLVTARVIAQKWKNPASMLCDKNLEAELSELRVNKRRISKTVVSELCKLFTT